MVKLLKTDTVCVKKDRREKIKIKRAPTHNSCGRVHREKVRKINYSRENSVFCGEDRIV
jgi:hypothetical protein